MNSSRINQIIFDYLCSYRHERKSWSKCLMDNLGIKSVVVAETMFTQVAK